VTSAAPSKSATASVAHNGVRHAMTDAARALARDTRGNAPPALRDAERDVRLAALRAGWWLGWLSIAAVLAGLALDLPARHRPALIALTVVAAAAHAGVMVVPWQGWLTAGRGRLLLDAWSGGLVAFVVTLIAVAGAKANLDLLLFLVVPFLATVHSGMRRSLWLAAALISYLTVMAVAPAPLTAGEVTMRVALLAAATLLTVVLRRLTRREAAARAHANAMAELEHALLAESHHRVKNSLQTVADLLLLGRPHGPDAGAFDETARRIRAIAAVHDLLGDERGGRIRGDALLNTVAAAAAVDARVHADPIELEPACAQRLAIVINELLTNAARHGRTPMSVELRSSDLVVLSVRDAGPGPNGSPHGVGLQLVDQVVTQALQGSFRLERDHTGLTLAEVRFPQPSNAHPGR
jgi:two-component sensor histidine kinase